MAKVQTALQTMRGICLALPEAVEAEHFGEVCPRFEPYARQKDCVRIDAADV
jgi:hypothetical protein